MIKKNSKAVTLKEGIKMKKIIGLGSGVVFGLMAMCLLLAVPVNAAIPQAINFQGILLDKSGSPIDMSKSHKVTFDMKAAHSWTETYDLVTTLSSPPKKSEALMDNKGFFSVALGTQNPIPFDQFDSAGATVSISLDGVLIGTQALVSMPYAFSAQNGTSGFTLAPSTASTMTPAGGTLIYDQTSKRMMYGDDTQWIQIDPAYTTSSVYSTSPIKLTVPSGPTYGSVTISNPGAGYILTGLSYGASKMNFVGTVKLEVIDGANTRISLILDQMRDGGNITFPIPIKFPKASTSLTLKITNLQAQGAGASFTVYDLSASYIPLPL